MVAMVEKLSRYKFEIIVFAAIVVAVFALYAPALKDNFVYDDIGVIANNPQITSLSNWPKAFTSCIWEQQLHGTCYGRTKYYRPLQTISIMFTYSISAQPFIFHLVSIIYYVILNCLVFLFLYKLFKNRLAAILGTALFLVHPVHAESVMWVSSAMSETLMGIFVVLALLAHISEWRGKNWWSAGFFLLALLSKETAIVIPLILIVYDYLWDNKKINKETLKGYVPHAIFLVYYLIMRTWAVGPFYVPEWFFMHVPLIDEVTSTLIAFGYYIEKFFYPYPLSPLLTIAPAKSIYNTDLIVGATALVAFIALVCWVITKRRSRVTGLSLAVAGLFLVPPLAALVINVHLKGELIVADRYLLMPILGAAMLFGWYGALIFRKSSKTIMVVLIVILVAAGAYATKTVWAQNAVWETNRGLSEYIHTVNLKRGILSARTDLSLALQYENEGNLSKAIELDLGILSQDDPFSQSMAATHLGDIYYLHYKDPDKARYYFKQALSLYPQNTVAQHNLNVLDGKEAPTR